MRYRPFRYYWKRNKIKKCTVKQSDCKTLMDQKRIYSELFFKLKIPIADCCKIYPFKIPKLDIRKARNDYVLKSIVVPPLFEITATGPGCSTIVNAPSMTNRAWNFFRHPRCSAYLYHIKAPSHSEVSWKEYTHGSLVSKPKDRNQYKPRFKLNSDRNHEFSDNENETAVSSVLSAFSKSKYHDSGISSQSSLDRIDSVEGSPKNSEDSGNIQVTYSEESSRNAQLEITTTDGKVSTEMEEAGIKKRCCLEIFQSHCADNNSTDAYKESSDDEDVLVIGLTISEYNEFK